eukprot:gene10705-22348_t
MAAFDESSQYSHWTFQIENLVSLRNEANKRYNSLEESEKLKVFTIEDESKPSIRAESTSSTEEDAAQYANDEAIIRYFCSLIRHKCSPSQKTPGGPIFIKRSWRVWCTAVVFFRRFYIHNSLLAHDPRIIVLSCLFLSAKVENEYISIDELLNKVYKGCTVDAVLEYELLVLEALYFHLRVIHPHNSSHALIADFKRVLSLSLSTSKKKLQQLQQQQLQQQQSQQQTPELSGSTDLHTSPSQLQLQSRLEPLDESQRQLTRQWVTKAETVMDAMMISYVILCFSPSILALAALLHTEPQGMSMTMRDYMTVRFGTSLDNILLETDRVRQLLPEVLVELDNSRVKGLIKTCLRSSVWGRKSKEEK